MSGHWVQTHWKVEVKEATGILPHVIAIFFQGWDSKTKFVIIYKVITRIVSEMLHDSSGAGRDDIRMEDHKLFSKIAYAFVFCTAPCDIKEACITCTSSSCHEAQLKFSETREHRFYFTFSLFGFFNNFFHFFVSTGV